jgi:Zn-dependent protease
MAQAGVMINVVLMVLNLLPLPPLDGGRIAVSLLPHDLAYRYAKVERYGFIILIVLLFTGVLSKILEPFIFGVISLISWLF